MTECMCTNMKWIKKCWVSVRKTYVDKSWWDFVFWFGAISILPYLERMASSKNKMNVHIYGFWMLTKNKYRVKIFLKSRFLGGINYMANYFKVFRLMKESESWWSQWVFMWQKQQSTRGSPIPKLPHLKYLIYVAFQVFSKLKIGYSHCCSV